MSHVTCHVSHVTCHMSRVTCHVSHVTCHVSHVTCHVSHVTCHMSHVIYIYFFSFFFFFFFLFFGQSGEAYRWRVCYQRGLPRLVFLWNMSLSRTLRFPIFSKSWCGNNLTGRRRQRCTVWYKWMSQGRQVCILVNLYLLHQIIQVIIRSCTLVDCQAETGTGDWLQFDFQRE